MSISETFLPGVGRKFQVETTSGDRLVIVIHDDGTRELYHFTRRNMDRASSVLQLSDGEARQIAGIINDAGNVLGMMPHPERAIEPAHGNEDGRRLFEGLLEAVA